MADIVGYRSDGEKKRFKDMGDGTWAEVVASVGVSSGTGGTATACDIQSIYRTQVITTVANLAANGVYTSASSDGINFKRITGKGVADVAGSLAIQQSDDNTTWDTVSTVAFAATVPQVFDVVLFSRYVRFVYTNGATIQAAFRLSGFLAAQ